MMEYSVFTKPWPDMSLPELAAHVRQMGFDAVELPVRPGFQVEPAGAARGLAEARHVLAEEGLRIASVAAEVDEAIIAACGAADVSMLRTLVRIRPDERYMAVMERTIRAYEALVPALQSAGVTLVLQNHCKREISSTMGVRYVVEQFEPRHVAAALDLGHCGLAGEDPDEALDQIGAHLGMVNLKNAYWYRTNGPEADEAAWSVHWTAGPHGMCSWRQAARELKRRQYDGPLCFSAEYSDASRVEELATADLAYAKRCFAETATVDAVASSDPAGA